MTTITKVLSHSLMASAHYSMNNEMTTYEKDGNQQLALGMLATNRLSILVNELQTPFPEIKLGYFSLFPIGMGLLTAVASPFAQRYLGKPEEEKNPLLSVISKVTVEAGRFGKFFCDRSNLWINTACCVSYVAMIALGFSVQGIVGLTGLFLIAVKRAGYMPLFIDQYLEPVFHLASAYSTLTAPTILPLKILQISLYAFLICDYFFKKNFIKALLPKSLQYPSPGNLIIKEKHKWGNFTSSSIFEKTSDDSAFKVNMTSLYAPELSAVFPADFDQKTSEADPEDLFNALEREIQERSLVLDSSRQQGLSRLKNGLINGRVEDQCVPNMDMFQKVMKTLISSILKDKRNFEENVKEMTELGNKCIEGWVREISFLLLPETQNARWSVHHELALLRGHLLKEELLKINQHRLNLDFAGGFNNVHVVNAMNMALWHRLRTYEGEVSHALQGFNLFQTLILNRMHMEKGRELSSSEAYFIGMCFALAYPGPAPAITPIAPIILRETEWKYRYHPEQLVDTVYEAIQPRYEVQQAGAANAIRKISWDAIASHLAEMNNCPNGEKLQLLDENSEYHAKWVQVSCFGEKSLTKDGVRLLLWDLGVLQPKTSL